MELFNLPVTTALLIYKISSLAAGTVICFMGYKLFTKNIWGECGKLEGSYEKSKLVFIAAAPGAFFAFLGAVVLITCIVKDFSLSNREERSANQSLIKEDPSKPQMPPYDSK